MISKESRVSRPLFDYLFFSPSSVRLPRTREVFIIEQGPEFADHVSVVLSLMSELKFNSMNIPCSGGPFNLFRFGYTGHYIPLPKSVNIHNYMNMWAWLWIWGKYGPR